MKDLQSDYQKRQRKLLGEVRPLFILEIVLGLATVLAFVLGPKGSPNLIGLVLLCLTPVVNIWRNAAMFQKMDEYERLSMLRAIAVAGLFLLAGVFITGMIGAFSAAEAVSPFVLLVLFLAAHVVFGIVHSVILKRESSE